MIDDDERRLAAWLQAGPERGPAEGQARALAATRGVEQRPAWIASLTSPQPRAADALDGVPLRLGGARTWLIVVALVALLAMLGALLVGQGLPRPRNLLAYCADAQLYVVPANGGTPTPLLQSPACFPQWSPDGSWLLAVNRDTADIWGVRPDGSGARVVASGTDPHWSPDGRAIAFMRLVDGIERPILHDLQSGDEQQLTVPEELGQVALLGWVDTAHVLVRDCSACETTPESDARWWVLPSDRPVPIHEPGMTMATLSPDGARLAWSKCSAWSMENCGGLLVTDVATGTTTQVAPPPHIAYDPMTWNATGDTIVYPEGDTPDSDTRLAATRLDGTRISLPLPWDRGLQGGAYSPDDARIAVVRLAGATTSLVVLDADGAAREIASANAIEDPAWQPPGNARVAVAEPAAVPPDPCLGARPTSATPLEVDGRAGCVRLYGSDTYLSTVDFDQADAVPDLGLRTSDRASLTAGPGARLVAPVGDGSCPPTSRMPAVDVSGDVETGRSWCLVTSAGGVVLLRVRAGWAASRPLELDYDVFQTGHDAGPEGDVSTSPGAVRSSDAGASFIASAPPALPSCETPSTPAGAIAAGCVVVPQTWTFSLDRGTVVQGPADLWFEAATETRFYLSRSFDWLGPMTGLRLLDSGGRGACLDALAAPDPSPVKWPTSDSPAAGDGQVHGIPFDSLHGAIACAISQGGHVFEVQLRGMAGHVSIDGLTFTLADFAWIDWGTR
jgi:hypothetical protein